MNQEIIQQAFEDELQKIAKEVLPPKDISFPQAVKTLITEKIGRAHV